MHRRLFAISLAFACACQAPPSTEEPPDAVTEDGAAAADFCNATDPRTVPVEVHATPEAGEAPYVDALATAQHDIRVQVYLMGYGGMAAA